MFSFGKITLFKNQDYKKLKDESVKNGTLFVDPEFPPDDQSLFFSKKVTSDVKWMRPGEIVDEPHLFVDGASCEDFHQGELGNCWFVAACACIAQDSRLWKRVVPNHEEQEWGEKNQYGGIFHFQFFVLGEWVDVVIDDLLPTRRRHLLYVTSGMGNEFWSPLLEKAYAKLFGCYEVLDGGRTSDALVNMVGGVGDRIALDEFTNADQDQKDVLFSQLHESSESYALLSASISARKKEQMEARLDCGLVQGHAYSITAIKRIPLGTGLFSIFNTDKLNMIRLRNPWGAKEWTGAWSDGSEEWKQISKRQKNSMGLTFENNGEFWMSFSDFLKWFTTIDVCHMINTSIFSLKKTWKESLVVSEWKRPNRSGGCKNHDTFLQNPQILFTVKQEGKKEDIEVLISLEQEDQRCSKDKGIDNQTIGFGLMKSDINRKYRMHDELEVVDSGPYINSRSIFKRVRLKPGRYCLIPSAFDPGHEGKLMVRIYTPQDANHREATKDHRMPGLCGCIPEAVAATQVTAVSGEGIRSITRPDKVPSTYCKIKVEGKSVETMTHHKTSNPEWDCRAVFYTSSKHTDITVEVWNDISFSPDELLGRVVIKGGVKHSRQTYRLTLRGKDDDEEEKNSQPGKITVEVKHFNDIDEA